MPFQFLLNFAHDDSFFYIKTASNFSKGLGSTFDGVNITNGYHPLYFISLVLLFFIPNFLFKTSPEFLFRLVFLYHLVMIIFMQYYIIKSFKNIFKKDFGNLSYLLLAVLFFVFVFIRDFGLESHLACVIVSFFLYIKSIELKTGENKIFIKSLLLSGLFLVRTDYIFSFIPLILLVDVFIGSNAKKYIITSLIILFSTVFIYSFCNYIFFGEIDTISGSILNSFPETNLKSNINTLLKDSIKLYNQFVRIIFVLISFIMFGLFCVKSKKKDNIVYKFYLMILSLGTGSILFVSFHLLFNRYSIREWYMTLPVFVAIVMLTILLSRKKIVLNISLILSAIVLIYVFYGTRVKNLKYVSSYEYAKSLNMIVSKNENIFQIDCCGVVGFFFHGKLINGDGFINSFEYMDCIKNGKINEYLKKYNVKYYSTYSTTDLLKDSVYVDEKFSYKVNGKKFSFPASSLVLEKEFDWNQIALNMKGKWYLFKFNEMKNFE
jgi:hypothetical protein